MRKGLLIAGLILSSGAFLVMLRGVLFVSLDGILALPVFGGMSYVFARKLMHKDKEIITHIGWVLIANGVFCTVLPLCLTLGSFGYTEIGWLVFFFGLGTILVVIGNKRKKLAHLKG